MVAPRDNKWHILKPLDGLSWTDVNFASNDSFLRFGAPAMTIFIVHLVRKQGIWHPPTGKNEYLFECEDTSPYYKLYRQGGSSEDLQVTGQMSFEVQNNSSDGAWNAEGFDINNEYGTSHWSQINAGIQFTAIVLSDDDYIEGGFYINGRRHKKEPTVDSITLDNEVVPQNFHFFQPSSGSSDLPTSDWLVGMAWHEDPMTEEEIFMWRQQIEMSKDIPLVPTLPGLTALDYVWSVKAKNGLFSGTTWSSDGASSPKTFSAAGVIGDYTEIIRTESTFRSR